MYAHEGIRCNAIAPGFLVSNQIIGELQELLNREKLERLRRAQEGDYRVV